MAKKRYINTKFWDDNYVVNLDPTEKLLFLYFLTNPLTDICGIYEIPLKRVAFDTGIDKEMVIKIIDRFSKDQKIYYIDGWIYVKNFAKHQAVNESVEKGIERSINLVPNVILAKIQEIDTDCIQAVPSCDLPKPKPKPKLSLMNERDFESFYSQYPRKVGKAKAKSIFLKLGKNELPIILASLEKQKLTEQWQTPRYIPHPATWLNQKRWEDEEDEMTPAQYAEHLYKIYGDQAIFHFLKKYDTNEAIKHKVFQ